MCTRSRYRIFTFFLFCSLRSDDPSAENVGHKWTLSALLRHLKAEGKNTALLMSQVEDLVIKAILASANSVISACKMFVPNPCNCFGKYCRTAGSRQSQIAEFNFDFK